ncbi:MAG: DUF1232 domain-containing protein [Clostridiales bacterium]|jgi:uncharacterized membrane protein YkvA (DUF1232 family)|nr:DUF1232 domain-containing protein [Clostridiales bacterium]
MRLLKNRIKAIIPFLRNPDVKIFKKLIVVLAAAYFIVPIDLIPIFIFPIGLLDDLFLWAFILIGFGEELDASLKKKTEEEYVHKNFHGKNVVDGVKYKVRKEKNEEDEDDEE